MSEAARPEALARLDVFVGEWALEARFPDAADGAGPQARATFEWILDGQFLVQRTQVPVPEAPDSLIVVGTDPQTGGYSQHYYDSRGVSRRYAMSLDAGVWRLVRDAPDFSPLDFCQRFIGTFSDDRTAINGVWEKSSDGQPGATTSPSPTEGSADMPAPALRRLPQRSVHPAGVIPDR